jgi:hypothetical protein
MKTTQQDYKTTGTDSGRMPTNKENVANGPHSDADVREYVAYYANLLAGTNRSARFDVVHDQEGMSWDALAEDKAARLAEEDEVLIKVEECRPRRFRAILKVTKTYRVFVEEDSFDEAKAEVEYQIREGADVTWEDRCYNEAEIVSLEEEED